MDDELSEKKVKCWLCRKALIRPWQSVCPACLERNRTMEAEECGFAHDVAEEPAAPTWLLPTPPRSDRRS